MTEKLSLVLRALIYQADKHPGVPASAHLTRGLELQVTRSTQTPNYKLQCGRKRNYASNTELTIVAANWPQATSTIEWKQIKGSEEGGTNWFQAVVKPVLQEAEKQAT